MQSALISMTFIENFLFDDGVIVLIINGTAEVMSRGQYLTKCNLRMLLDFLQIMNSDIIEYLTICVDTTSLIVIEAGTRSVVIIRV